MDFSSLVLMEKDKETGYVKAEKGSFEVDEKALYIKKLYLLDETVYVYFDTNKDVEEWEYSAIYDLFDEKSFLDAGFELEEMTEEYNPTYIAKFKYEDDYELTKEKLYKCIDLIYNAFNKVFYDIKGKEEEYKNL